jgi:hypothetical protein
VPVSVPLPLSSCELPCRHVHETKGHPAFRVRPNIGLFLEPDDETGVEKPSERFSRQAVGCAQDVGLAPLATAHDISSTPPRLKPPLHGLYRRRLLTGRCTPVRGLNSFFLSLCVQCPKGNFQLFCDSGLRKPHEKDRRKDQQSSTRGLCILHASHATWVLSARMMALPIRCCIVAHHFYPERTYYREGAQLLCLLAGR